MEILELAHNEEIDETLYQPQVPPTNFADQEIDLAAFRLWRGASRVDMNVDPEGSD